MSAARGPASPFDNVPQDVLEKILHCVSGGVVNYDFLQASQVCQQWNQTLKGLVEHLAFKLRLKHEPVTESPTLAIVCSLQFPNLKFLRFERFCASFGGWSQVFETLGTNCPRLESLEILRAKPNISEVDVLVLHKSLPQLRNLALPGNCFSNAAALLCLAHFTSLATLHLAGTNLAEALGTLSGSQALALTGSASCRQFTLYPSQLIVNRVQIVKREGTGSAAQLNALVVSCYSPILFPLNVRSFQDLHELVFQYRFFLIPRASERFLQGLDACRLLRKLHLALIFKSFWPAIAQMTLLEELAGSLVEVVSREDVQCLTRLPFLKRLEIVPPVDEGDEGKANRSVLGGMLASFPATNQLQRLVYPLHWHDLDETCLGSLPKLLELRFEQDTFGLTCCMECSGALPTAVIRLLTLKKLHLGRCYCLRSASSLEALSSLEILNVVHCDQLESLKVPVTSPLRHLKVVSCRQLSSIPVLSPTLTSLNLCDLPRVTELPPFSHVALLRSLRLVNLRGLSTIPPLNPLQSLCTLKLKRLTLRTLPPLDQLGSLLRLYIADCKELEELPPVSPLLLRLQVERCRKVTSLPDDDGCSDQSQSQSQQQRSKLKILELMTCDALTECDIGTDRYPCLEHVVVANCPCVHISLTESQMWQETRFRNAKLDIHAFSRNVLT